jgi:hypothetical protein
VKRSDQRWRTRLIDPALLAQLERELPASTLWSVLLGVVAQRAQQAPAAVLRQWQQNRFVAPASVGEERRVRILASPACAPLAHRIAAELPHLGVVHEPLTQAYYAGLRFMIDVRTPHGGPGAADRWWRLRLARTPGRESQAGVRGERAGLTARCRTVSPPCAVP